MMQPHYLISIDGESGVAIYSAPLGKSNCKFFFDSIVPNIRTLDPHEYATGLAYLVQFGSPRIYIMHSDEVYWCVEWEPGLIVIRFSPSGSFGAAAFRSPIPNFAGRTPLPEDLEGYNEDAVNPLYDLIFTAWDAQFDDEWRVHYEFAPAAPTLVKKFDAALVTANVWHAALQEMHAKDVKQRIQNWAGQGIRIKL